MSSVINQLKTSDGQDDLMPVTKTQAVYDNAGNRLDNTLAYTPVYSETISTAPAIQRDADTLAGHTPGYFATASSVSSLTGTVNGKANASHTHNDKLNVSNPVATGSFSLGRMDGVTIGGNSFAAGGELVASGWDSHAEGYGSIASGTNAHAEGYYTTASDTNAHAEGYYTTASGSCSHVGGTQSVASGSDSFAHGYGTLASNSRSTAFGTWNVMNSDTHFAVGRGSSDNYRVNAFSVSNIGVVKASSTITASTTADYAEYFEWLDSNPDNEDRVGYFVTLDGDKIRIATEKDNYILGVVSGAPFVLGNGDCDVWNGMFLRDEFRRPITEPKPKEIEITDEDGNLTGEIEIVEGEFDGIRQVINPEYDCTKKYISRADRPEWAPVGMLGVLPVRHDGTAKVNGYVTVNADGIATSCKRTDANAYRVIKSNSDSVVEIIFR